MDDVMLGATESFRVELTEALGDAAVSTDRARRLEYSRDASWLSPILSSRLPESVADIVASPDDVASISTVLSLASRHRVPVTPRGRATGNYGQSVPLHGGVVLDLTGCSKIVDVGDGWIRAEPGASFIALEAAARATGQELAMFPSTMRSTLGGFVGGGAGGIGSIENGLIWDDHVTAVDVVACLDEHETITAEGAGVAPFVHAYGTTGVLSSITVRLVPKREWTALYASFGSFDAAVAAGRSIIELDPLPRNLSIDEPGVVDVFTSDPTAMPPGTFSVRVIAERSTVDAIDAIVGTHDGTVTAIRPDGVGALVSMSYNHVTLRAKRARPDVCHVQAGGDAVIDRADDIRELFGGGLIHLDAHAVGGHLGFGALVLSDFVDEATLRSRMERLAAMGVFVVDPHTWALGGEHLDEFRAAASTFDPHGLLNPGKLPR